MIDILRNRWKLVFQIFPAFMQITQKMMKVANFKLWSRLIQALCKRPSSTLAFYIYPLLLTLCTLKYTHSLSLDDTRIASNALLSVLTLSENKIDHLDRLFNLCGNDQDQLSVLKDLFNDFKVNKYQGK